MADQELKWVDGQSVLAQANTTVDVELAWFDGQSGLLPLEQPSGGGGEVDMFIMWICE